MGDTLCFKDLCTRDEIENILNMRVRDITLYQEALLHKSAVKLYNASRSNERLEFVGDSVLNFIIAKYLYDNYPDENEGFMTKLRTRLVSGKCLSQIAKNMGLQHHIRMNEKALRQTWNENARILEDALESLIGAIYLDQGLYITIQFILSQMRQNVDFDEILTDTNYKDILMRYTQMNGIKLPVYNLIHEDGPNHSKSFMVEVIVDDKSIGNGYGKSKKAAEQNAAHQALLHLKHIE